MVEIERQVTGHHWSEPTDPAPFQEIADRHRTHSHLLEQTRKLLRAAYELGQPQPDEPIIIDQEKPK